MVIPTALKCRTRKNLTPAERAEAIAYLLSISRLWRRSVKAIQAGAPIDYESGRKCRSGRKSRLTSEFRVQLNEVIELIPLEDRTDIRTLASSLDIAKSTLHDYYQAGVFRSHSAHVKPLLTDKQRAARVEFAAGFVRRGPGERLTFNRMMDFVHLDEKWFYLKKDKQRVDREIYRQALCRMVISRIKEVWPSGKRVVLQHDNAKPHVAADDPEVVAACSLGNWNMKICPQPANSPDFNANDLGFFNSLQSLQYK
ncbi:hypothetical protein F442_21018 [Phytophthora nicotianae P10297]|uniref:Transposase Tc1-like domain-containing protein n=1 Tax=Phytophthora nicotianae P10297 TaxID=1317064 RepID=W2Y5J6_PHYNI|nr:hypothetical protein F442_21018 [Phytophthora nicotianae P10297]